MWNGHHEPCQGREKHGDADDTWLVPRSTEVPDEYDNADMEHIVGTLHETRLGAAHFESSLQGSNDSATVRRHNHIEDNQQRHVCDEQR